MDIYKTALTWTLDQLDQDVELEKFVAGIPGLYESEIFSKVGADSADNGRDDIQRTLDNIRPILAVFALHYLAGRGPITLCATPEVEGEERGACTRGRGLTTNDHMYYEGREHIRPQGHYLMKTKSCDR